jgi:hypothetical protein
LTHELNIRPDLKLVCFRFTGQIRVPDVRDAFLDWANRPEFDASYVMLSDGRRVTTVDATFLGILTAAQGVQADLKKFDQGALSVVLVSTQTVFGMARILEQVLDFTSKLKMVTVWSPEEAMQLARRSDLDFDELFAF